MPISSRFVVRSTIILLTVGFLTLLGIVGATIWLGERSQIYFNVVTEARGTRAAAVELRSALQTAESSQRGFLITGNQIYLAPFDSAKAQALRQLAILDRTLEKNAATEALLARIAQILKDKIREMDATIALRSAGRDREALEMMNTDRGKALTDEANLFLSGIIRRAEERLSAGVGEQNRNAIWLRWVSVLGGLLIVLVVGGVTVTTLRYAKEIAQSRDRYSALNASLEERVKLRTADLTRARDHAEVLVTEVNHRVANSLSMVMALVQLQIRSIPDQVAKDALAETQARINAIASVHKRLYSSGDVRVVSLDEYLAAILDQLETTMRSEGKGASLRYTLEPLKLATDTSVNLGVVMTELVTNAFKYAYPDGRGEVRVRLNSLPESRIELVVEDDGVGRRDEASSRGTGLGTRIVSAMATTMEATIEYLKRDPGTAARLVFPLKQATA
jgi:two-component sensor histidine kinase/CHASE3 domain sensor protein